MADPIITIKQGQLRGTTDTDIDGGKFYKFSGIPYAKPPVDSLRFKAPQPAEPWDGIREADKEGSPCLSFDFISSKIVGSEDCLYLNIYTKEVPKTGQKLKPVMVFMHGGAFTLGSGSEMMAGPKQLLTQDIVLVAINYRLGIFGFLSTDDTTLDAPGNAGLKDQTLALKWVQENISSFNGDPNNVTIFGISAGGASVHFQLLSPTAKGLFQKAIVQSGVALNPWAWGQKNAIQVAEKLGHTVSSEKEALEVLLKAQSTELFQAAVQLPDLLIDSSKRRPFGPVIEKPNPSAFLTENPSDLLASGRYNQVPTIIGLVSDEGLIYDFMVKVARTEADPLECGILWNLGLKEGSEKREKIKQLIKDFYFKDGVTKDAIYKLIGDTGFTVGTVESIKLALRNSSSPIYSYLFSYEIPRGNMMKKFFGLGEDVKGITHGADQTFLFSSSLMTPPGSKVDVIQKEDRQGIDNVVKIWTDFAKTGKPHALWEPTDSKDLKYFIIDKNVSMKQGPPFPERSAFWESIMKEVAGINATFKERP